MPAAGVAAVLVALTLVAVYMVPKSSAPRSLYQSIDSLGHSNSVALLVQERETIIAMDAATQTLTVAAKPAMADPQQILANQGASTGTSSGTGGGTGIVGTPPPANPTAAEQIGKAELPAFGFSQSTQWPCLYNLWERESGWVYDAENPSGAYGIPQALPGDKMATVAADWQTDPRTQIIWGLGYIKTVYGTPCVAWQHEIDYGYY